MDSGLVDTCHIMFQSFKLLHHLKPWKRMIHINVFVRLTTTVINTGSLVYFLN